MNVELAIAKGFNQIPVVRIEKLSPWQLRLYAIAANRLADVAGYDDALLAEELREVERLDWGTPSGLVSWRYCKAALRRPLGRLRGEAIPAIETLL